MDEHLAKVALLDGDLVISRSHGFAYQHDMRVTAKYDADYWAKYRSYEGTPIATAINRGRLAILDSCYGCGPAVDIGIGSGEFIRGRPETFGHDVNPVAVAWLKEQGLWAEDLSAFRAFTMWDVVEHCPEPARYFQLMPEGSVLCTSIPLFADLSKVRDSRHYRPGEHLYYFTEDGFVRWMHKHGFEVIDRREFEIAAGRDSIYTFAFEKCA